MDITYTIELFSYWHCGSGLSAGADVDSLVIKDAKGMPFVPGKTIKGLIREAAETLICLAPGRYPSQEIIDVIFGVLCEYCMASGNSTDWQGVLLKCRIPGHRLRCHYQCQCTELSV